MGSLHPSTADVPSSKPSRSAELVSGLRHPYVDHVTQTGIILSEL